MVSLSENGFKDRPVKLILQSDEEVNSRFSKGETINFMIEKAKDSVAFINLEPGKKDGVCINRKGIITYTFTVKGISAHSSLCAISGANAILEASYKIIEAEKLKDHNGITCNCGTISGGTVANTVPEECTFKANVRYFTKEQKAWTDKFMTDLANDVKIKGCSTTVSFGAGRPPMELTKKNEKFAERLNEIFRENGMTKLKPFIGTGGSDAAQITEAGIPCVDCLGVIGDRIHSKDEYAEIESLREYAKRLALIALYI
jgi:glutamate carboxypeptidase